MESSVAILSNHMSLMPLPTRMQPGVKFKRLTRGSSFKPLLKKAFKVALVDRQAGVRESWSKFINSFPDFACVCACSTGEEALRMSLQHQPDVVLVDICLPRMSGITCTRRLKTLLPKTQIVMLTALEDMEWVCRALQAGADGYLLKRTEPADLRMALQDVVSGGAPLTNLIANHVITSFRRQAKVRYRSARLTEREEQILRLVSEGCSNRLIANELALSLRMVESHLQNIFTKMQVRSRAHAAVRFMANKCPAQKPESCPQPTS